MHSRIIRLIAVLVFTLPAALRADPPKNVILFIGDGMGPEQILAAEAYAGGDMIFRNAPYQAMCTTYANDDPVTDSAAAGSAIATGFKVNNGVISLDPITGEELLTLLEDAAGKGKSTGLVTTSHLTHATPATFGAHAASRSYFAEIAADYLNDSRPNVLFGGGDNGLTVADSEVAGYTVVTDLAGLTALDPDPLAPEDVLFSAQIGTYHLEYLYDYFSGGSYASYPDPMLHEMVSKSLEVLDNNTENGFFLMVEGARIDHACHVYQLERAIHEVLGLEAAVQVVLDWAAGRDDTLILLTADHETGGLAVVQDHGPGLYPDVTWSTGSHTAADVPVFAWGRNAEFIGGTMDNTDFFDLCTLDASEIPQVLVPAGAVWRYHDGGSDLGTAWREFTYDASIWAAGFAQLGYGDGDEATVISYGTNASAKHPCYYFRHTFTVDDPSRVQNLRLSILRDDGCVVYLNGQEVARYNLPAGDVTYSTLATTAGEFGWDPETDIPNLLVAGDNLLAVEVHQASASSSDLSLDLELTATFLPPASTPPTTPANLVATAQSQSEILVTWEDLSDNESEFELESSVHDETDYQPFGTVPANTTAAWVSELAADTLHFYRVRARNAAGYSADYSNTAWARTLPPNQPPTADTRSEQLAEDSAAVITLSGSDPEGDPLSFSIDVPPVHGSLGPVIGAEVVYTPDADYSGPDTFSYYANDGLLPSELPATVTITVDPVNDVPTVPSGLAADAGNRTVSLSWNVSTDADPGDAVSYSVYRSSTSGSGYAELDTTTDLVFTDHSVVNGMTYYYVVTARDGTEESGPSTEVQATPDVAPIYAYATQDPDVNIGNVVGEYTATLSADGLTQNIVEAGNASGSQFLVTYRLDPSRIPGEVAGLTLYLTASWTGTDAPDEALVVECYNNVDGTWDDITADIQGGAFTPAGPEKYLAGDGAILVRFSDSARIRKEKKDTLAIDEIFAALVEGAPNQAPIASGQSLTTDEDVALDITLTGSDPESGPLTYEIATAPGNGTISGSAPDVTYTPNLDFHGIDSFTFRVNDGIEDSASATVSITVNPVNDAPLAVADAYSMEQDTTLNVTAPGILGNDSDVDGGPLTANLVDGPATGILNLGADGSFDYTPDGGFTGEERFTYTAGDGSADSAPVTVTIQVNRVNQAPVAVNENYSVNEDSTLDVVVPGVLVNDTDGDGDSLTAALVGDVSDGSLSLNDDGSFSYTPDAEFNGIDSFTYTASDGLADSAVATVTITVYPVNDAPVADPQSVSTDAGVDVSITLTGSDVDGDSLGYTVLAGPSHGLLSGTAPNLVYSPEQDFAGSDSFSFIVNDGTADSAEATVTITVQPVQSSMFVQDIALALVSAGKNTKAEATVLIHDGSGAVAGATVHGDWYFRGSLAQSDVVGTTDATGRAVLISSPEKAKAGEEFRFVVTDVVLTGGDYDSGANVESEESITIQ